MNRTILRCILSFSLVLGNSGCGPLPSLPPLPAEGETSQRGLLITMEAIYFDFDKAALNPAALQTIDNLVAVLKQQETPHYVVAIDGYTDIRGQESYNLNLSRQRAENVKAAFMARGIAEQQLDAKGFGQADPVANNQTENGRRQNRRVEILVLQPLDKSDKTAP